MVTEPPPIPADAITYQLVIELRRRCRISPGRLGAHELAAGRYVYTGSARRHMRARLQRHLRRDKPLRWHIDWLLTRPQAEVVAIHVDARPECEVNRATGGAVPIAGFGASDCRARCGSHLRYMAA